MSFAARVRKQLNYPKMMSCAASLAYHGLLGQAEENTCLVLKNVDLTSVPSEHLAALATWVTSTCRVSIQKVKGIGLTSLLNSLRCGHLLITFQSLYREETLGLVQALESSVEGVQLESVTLDMETMVTYSGQGRCREVRLFRGYNEDYEMWRVNLKEPLKCWAMSRDWAVTAEKQHHLVIKREIK